MKRRDLTRTMENAGWIITHGAKHDLAKRPDKPGVKIPIPRHSEIPEYTANQILREAGLK